MTRHNYREPDATRLEAAREALAAATAAASAPEGRADRAESTRPAAAQPAEVVEAGATRHSGGADGVARARQIALRQLAMGARTRSQLADKMRQRDCSAETIEQVLDRMSEVGLVDDQAFAHMLVRAKHEGSGLALRGLRHELRKKGVPQEMAERAIATIEPQHERAQAEALVAARLPRLHGLDREVQMRRLGGLLARKGYPAGLSFAVIRDALDQAPEHIRD